MLLIDTHAHLYASEFDDDRNDMLQRAYEVGVKKVLLPNIDSSSIPGMYNLVEKYPEQCFAMMGLHPCYVNENYEEELGLIKKALLDAKCPFYAIGEIGLDFYWDTTYKEEQIKALRLQIEWAKTYHLPIVLHCRDSFDETYAIVSELNDKNLRGVFHCFSGGLTDAKKVVALGGFYMGLGGVATYKKTDELSEAIEQIPLNYFVLETDAPYLSPEPYRTANRKDKKRKHKNRNESAYVYAVAQKVADIKKISLNEVANVTSENAQKLFQLKK
jgi:TatD DNase family protein